MQQLLFIVAWIFIIAGGFAVILGALTVIGLLDIFFGDRKDEYHNLNIFEGDED